MAEIGSPKRLHFVGFDRVGTIPLPERMLFSPASTHDLSALRTHVDSIEDRSVMCDKAYANGPLQEQLWQQQGVSLLTPIKLKRGQKHLDAADKQFSTAVSRIRQPVESFFNWLIEKTDIQKACKVRSENGLILHCLGRLATALYIMLVNP